MDARIEIMVHHIHPYITNFVWAEVQRVTRAGRIYCFSREGKTVVLQANKHLTLLAENQLDGPVFASPACVCSAIYVRTDSHLYCLSARPARPAD